MYVFDNGYQSEDRTFMVAGSSTADVNDKNRKALWIDIPIQTFLIDHPEGCILFDTACSPHHATAWPEFINLVSPYTVTEEQTLFARLKNLGLTPNDIATVVISHLHVDHAGNLSAFKKAKIYVSDVELTTTVRNYVVGDDLDVHVPVDIEAFIAARLNWRPVMEDEKELEIAPGVTILNLGSGHSWGMLALRVDLGNSGTFLLVADALYMRENLGPPIRVPGIIHDTVGYKRTAKFLENYARKHGATILFGHDMEQFKSLRKPPEYYD
jgi:glyoxylase-like metal-dependent hydrolase (beta-lactamase superfamily II)